MLLQPIGGVILLTLRF